MRNVLKYRKNIQNGSCGCGSVVVIFFIYLHSVLYACANWPGSEGTVSDFVCPEKEFAYGRIMIILITN